MSIKPLNGTEIVSVLGKKLPEISNSAETVSLLGRVCAKDEAVFHSKASEELLKKPAAWKSAGIINKIKEKIWTTRR